LSRAIDHAELLEHDFAALHALGALVFVELLPQVALDLGAGGDLALDLALDGQAGLFGRELDQLVDQRKELFGLVGGDVGFRLGRGCGGRLLGGGERRGLLRPGHGREAKRRAENPSVPGRYKPTVLLAHLFSFDSGLLPGNDGLKPPHLLPRL